MSGELNVILQPSFSKGLLSHVEHSGDEGESRLQGAGTLLSVLRTIFLHPHVRAGLETHRRTLMPPFGTYC